MWLIRAVGLALLPRSHGGPWRHVCFSPFICDLIAPDTPGGGGNRPSPDWPANANILLNFLRLAQRALRSRRLYLLRQRWAPSTREQWLPPPPYEAQTSCLSSRRPAEGAGPSSTQLHSASSGGPRERFLLPVTLSVLLLRFNPTSWPKSPGVAPS